MPSHSKTDITTSRLAQDLNNLFNTAGKGFKSARRYNSLYPDVRREHFVAFPVLGIANNVS